ncbi:glycoside hydrolase family 32 protein [Salinicoccus albus]|uniref:glycoside hydrolase family 32 protein n=1 Tax=Salinicoccus albus TaxID=418756 RepID=UPI000362A452|nr:sucrose-6-phosphate hydrolase [Salinicoccus albus]
MEEKRIRNAYRKLDDMSHKDLAELIDTVQESPWRQNYHVQPVTGLLSHPSGFVYHDGLYHLFYQWSPLDSHHGIEYWYHVTSEDLAVFTNRGVKIRPDSIYDSHGASSGSAFVIDEQVHIFYTGRRILGKGAAVPYQMHAVMDDRLKVRKDVFPLIDSVPEGFTESFKDPAIWEEADVFYMILGAQTITDYGRAAVYSTEASSAFEYRGMIRTDLEAFGFLWESPDFFTIDGVDVLAFCPHGIDRYQYSYWNAYQSGYIMGRLYRGTLVMDHGEFHEFDHGFDFYAPRTTVGKNGEQVLIGMMGIAGTAYPTDTYHWANCMTLPRVVTLGNGRLRQNPISALEKLRHNEISAVGYITHHPRKMKDFYGESYELLVDIKENNATEIYINLRTSRKEATSLIYNTEKRLLTLDIGFSGEQPLNVDGTKRSVVLEEDLNDLRVFVDVSSIEIFVNQGEAVMSSRIFPSDRATGVELSTEIGDCFLSLTKYDLTSFEHEKIIYNP